MNQRQRTASDGQSLTCQPVSAWGERRNQRTPVGLGAVEDGLVATHAFADLSKGSDDVVAELLALLLLADADLLDVAADAPVPDELDLCDQASRGYEPVCILVDDDDDVVGLRLGVAHPVELLCPPFLTHVDRLGQVAKDVEVAPVVVCPAQRSQLATSPFGMLEKLFL